MNEDPLYAPLRTRPPRPPRRGWAMVLVCAGAVLGLAGLGAVALKYPGSGERPTVAVAPIQPLPPPVPSPAVASAPTPPAAPGGITVQPNGDTVEIQNGVKIIRMAPARTGRTVAVTSADAPASLRAAPDPALVEHTAAGDLPRVGPDGLRPAEAYARPVAALPATQMGAPRLALLVGDLGPDQAQTAAAIERLPSAVSLAFRPDGPDAAGAVARAREGGHEVVLELPGPPPAAAGTGGDALRDLHAAMARFPGYIGVTAEIGGSFPAQAGRGGLTLRDLASRGLLLIDNTAAVAGRSPAAPGALAVSPDVVVDGRLAPGSVAAAFAQLERTARLNGHALGYAGHFTGPDAVAAALAGASARGLVLVPVSALAGGPAMPQVESSR